MTDEHGPHDALLATVEAFTALADGRRQLLTALASIEVDTEDLAETLGIVAAHDHALRAVALAYADGTRDFASFATPAMLVADDEGTHTVDTIDAARASFFDAIAAVADAHAEWLDDVIETPWGGRETWRMHLVALAMHDGAQAHAINEGDV